MPFYAVPRYIRAVPELPHTPTGKVEKYRLREEGVGDGTFDLHAEGYRASRKGLVPLDAPRASRG
jgi:crotonobetaine/carnitine-CoA ligase